MASNLMITPEIRLTYEKRLLQRFRTETVFNRFALQKAIPARGGDRISFRRMEIIRPVAASLTGSWPADATYTNAAAAVLTEGTFHVPAVVASWAEVVATVNQYGQAAYISDVALAQSIDDNLAEYVGLRIQVYLN